MDPVAFGKAIIAAQRLDRLGVRLAITGDVLLGLCFALAVFLLPAGFRHGSLNPEGYTAFSLFPHPLVVPHQIWNCRCSAVSNNGGSSAD
jgi:hypothetical protein